jgi:hypothetical protein
MASKFTIPLVGSLVIAACAAFGATASAAALCPTSESFFGTIQRVNGSMLTVQTQSGHTADVHVERAARMHTNGNSIRPGVFIGAYGCVTPNGVFNADEVTLTTNSSDYNKQLTGTVERIQTGALLVREDGHTGLWYVPSPTDFQVGQSLSAVGMISSNGSFYPQTINGRSVAFQPQTSAAPASNTITLTGTVRSVGTNMIMVWEPASRHNAKWMVSNAGNRFHVGQRVSATGREDRSGTFYVQQITIL